MYLEYQDRKVCCDLDYSTADDEDGIYVLQAYWMDTDINFTQAQINQLEDFMREHGHMIEAWTDHRLAQLGE